MAFHIPTQSRAIDPYSSYNSDNVNQLTRIVSKGNDVVSEGMAVSIIDSTSIEVKGGVVIKDDTMIHIQEDLNIDLTDPGWFVEGTAASDSSAYYYVVLDYIFQKVNPPNVATIKILKTRSNYSSRYMFLKNLTISNNQVVDVLDYDPENPSIAKLGAAVSMTLVDTLPAWTSAQMGQFYLINCGQSIAVGGCTDWVYFPSDSTSTTYATVETFSAGTALPTWTSADVGRILIIGEIVYIGGESGWINISNGVANSIDGVSNPGGDIDFIAGSNVTISSDNVANTITFSATGGASDTIDGVSNQGGDIDLVAGTNVTITPNNAANTITFSATGGCADSIEGVTNQGGNIDIIGTSGISVIGDDITNSITISGSSTSVNDTKTANITSFTVSGSLYYADINHAFDTTSAIVVNVFDNSDNKMIEPYDIELINKDNVRLWFEEDPTAIKVLLISPNSGFAGDNKHPASITSYTSSGGLYYSDVDHNFGISSALIVQCYDATTNKQIIPNEVELLSANTCRIWFTLNPGPVRALIISSTFTSSSGSACCCTTLDGVSNEGGNIDLVAGSGVQITPNDSNNTITISAGGAVSGTTDEDKITFQVDSTSFTDVTTYVYIDVTHNFNTSLPLLTQIWNSSGVRIEADVATLLNDNTLRLRWTVNPGDIQIVVFSPSGGGITLTQARRQALIFG